MNPVEAERFDLAGLVAERNNHDWYTRRVAEHHESRAAAGGYRAAAAAAENGTAGDGWRLERLARLTAAVEAGDTLHGAARRLWVEPGSLAGWLTVHGPDILAGLRQNGRTA